MIRGISGRESIWASRSNFDCRFRRISPGNRVPGKVEWWDALRQAAADVSELVTNPPVLRWKPGSLGKVIFIVKGKTVSLRFTIRSARSYLCC